MAGTLLFWVDREFICLSRPRWTLPKADLVFEKIHYELTFYLCTCHINAPGPNYCFLLFSMPLSRKNIIAKTTLHSGNLDAQF